MRTFGLITETKQYDLLST